MLDLDGRNRYVMTTAATLAPLLDLPRAQLELDGDTSATRAGSPRSASCSPATSDNVLDLLPGESRRVGAATAAEGWNAVA